MVVHDSKCPQNDGKNCELWFLSTNLFIITCFVSGQVGCFDISGIGQSSKPIVQQTVTTLLKAQEYPRRIRKINCSRSLSSPDYFILSIHRCHQVWTQNDSDESSDQPTSKLAATLFARCMPATDLYSVSHPLCTALYIESRNDR